MRKNCHRIKTAIKIKNSYFKFFFHIPKAWEGAIAVADSKDNGRVASHRYLTCRVVPDVVHPEFICSYLLYPKGLEKIRLASPGSVDRNRTLAVKRLERIEVPIPTMEKQMEFIQYKRKIDQALWEKQENMKQLDLLMPSLLNDVFKNASIS